MFTSKLYVRQKRRNNSVIHWNDLNNFGEIQFFVKIHDIVYVLVREFLRDVNRTQLLHPRVQVDICEVIIPVRETYNYVVLPIGKVQGKVLLVRNFICLPPNLYEKKL